MTSPIRSLVAATCIALTACGNGDPQPIPDWMAGCWQGADNGTRETWVIGPRETMLGVSTTTQDGSIGFFETMTIGPTGTGKLEFAAYPSGQAGARFVAVEADDRQIVFANPEHDFPQRIAYRRDRGILSAEISLADGSEARSFRFEPCA